MPAGAGPLGVTLRGVSTAARQSELPLVGRSDELHSIEAALAADALGGVVLSGPPGVGKTRLATEALRLAEAKGRTTAWVAATRAASAIPFGAFAHLLPVAAESPMAALDVLQRAGGEIRRRSPDTPLVVGIDDAHLLDDRSATLAHLLATTGAAFVLATVRGGVRLPDPLLALWKDGLAERVELQPLSRTDTDDLLEVALGGHVDAATRHRLWEMSAGNVLYLRELLLSGMERGALAERGGVWSWSGSIGGGSRLEDLVEDRLRELSDEERRVLDIVALAEPVGPCLVVRMASASALDSLEANGLLVVADDGRRAQVRLCHPVYAETLRAALGGMRRRSLLGELADGLAATGARRDDDTLRLACWRLDSGEPVSHELLLAAARRASALSDHPLAERLARAARDDGGGSKARMALAQSLYWQDRFQEAQQALDDLSTGEDGPDVVEETIVASSNLFWGLGRAREADELLLRTERRLPPGGAADELAAHRAYLAVFNGRAVDALATATAVLARSSPGTGASVRALIAAVPAWGLCGQAELAISEATAGLAAAERLSAAEPQLAGKLLAGKVLALLLAGRLEEMEEVTSRVYDIVASHPASDLRGLWALLMGRAALARGAAGTAVQRLREGAALLRAHDPGAFLTRCLASAAHASALLGHTIEAQELLAECEQRRHPSVRIHDFEVGLARAWVAAAGGRESAARATALAAADEAAELGHFGYEAMGLHAVVRLGDAPAVSRRLASSYAEGPIVGVYAAHASAVVAGDGGGLDEAAIRFAQLGALLLAAEAATDASEAHRRAGDRSLRCSPSRGRNDWPRPAWGDDPGAESRGGGPRPLAGSRPRNARWPGWRRVA